MRKYIMFIFQKFTIRSNIFLVKFHFVVHKVPIDFINEVIFLIRNNYVFELSVSFGYN